MFCCAYFYTYFISNHPLISIIFLFYLKKCKGNELGTRCLFSPSIYNINIVYFTVINICLKDKSVKCCGNFLKISFILFFVFYRYVYKNFTNSFD